MLAIDPDYVPALLLSIRAHYQLLTHGAISDEEQRRLGEERLDRVLAIDPDNGDALAFLAWGDWEMRLDLESAARRFSAALRTAPGSLLLTQGAGMFARSVGRHEESIALHERCVAADPVNTNCMYQLARSYLWAGRPDEAIQTFRRVDAVAGRKMTFYYLILALLLQGDPAAALAELELGRDDSPQSLAAHAMIMHDLDRLEESSLALGKISELADGQFREQAYLVAEAHAWIGDKDKAFEWLDMAYAHDERFRVRGYWFHRIMFLPIWQNLHDDPRWDAFRERMNMSAARYEAIEFVLPEWISLPDQPL